MIIPNESVHATTLSLSVGDISYAYRRIGGGPGLPLLCLQHFTGTLDNWDPAVVDELCKSREVILFDNAGVGRSTGTVPKTVGEMALDALAFADALGLKRCDILGFSLGGMVAQEIALARPVLPRRMILVATAPEGGEEIMHMEKPAIRPVFESQEMEPFEKASRLFFTRSASSAEAGRLFFDRLSQRETDQDAPPTPELVAAQRAAFAAWEAGSGERFAKLRQIHQPCLVMDGMLDDLIPIRNSYMLAEHLPNATLLTYPDAGHGALFQFHAAFNGQATAFLNSDDPQAPY